MARDSSENASLDQFSDNTEGVDESESDNTEGADGSESDDSTATSDDHEDKPDETAASGEPPPETARWSPDGETCERCETTTMRLWTDDGQMVCPDCKAWE